MLAKLLFPPFSHVFEVHVVQLSIILNPKSKDATNFHHSFPSAMTDHFMMELLSLFCLTVT